MVNQVKYPECGGELEEAEKDVDMMGRVIGQFKCEICKVCGSTFMDDEAMKNVEEKTKELGIFGMEKTTNISMSGNSLIIRINKKLAEFLQLTENTTVQVYPIDKRRFIVEKT